MRFSEPGSSEGDAGETGGGEGGAGSKANSPAVSHKSAEGKEAEDTTVAVKEDKDHDTEKTSPKKAIAV